MPPTLIGPILTFAPSTGLVINEFTTISVIGVLTVVAWEEKRWTHGNVRLEQSAPIARAQIDRDQFGGREAFEIVEGKGGLAVSTFAPDGDFPGSHIHLRNKGVVIADEKRVSRGDGGAKIFDRGFVVGRPIAELE